MTPGKPGVTDYIWLLLLAMIWGSSFMFIKLASDEIPPSYITAGRISLAAIVFMILVWVMDLRLPRRRRAWIVMIGAALFGSALPFYAIAWGQVYIDSGLAAMLMALTPLATPTLAHIFTRDEKWNLQKFIGIVIGFIGVGLIIGPEHAFRSEAGFALETLGALAVLSGALCYSISALLHKLLAKDAQEGGFSFRALSAGTMMLAAAMTIPAALWIDPPALPLSGSQISLWLSGGGLIAIVSVVFLGLVPTASGNLVMLKIIRAQGASFLSTVNYLVPVIGVALGIIFLGERPALIDFAGLALILGGIFTATRLGAR